MKGALAVLGVIVVGAAAYFIAKGKSSPTTTSAKKPAGGSVGKQIGVQLASKLLTSDNISALGGLAKSVVPNGGAAKVAPTTNNGFVTEADLTATTSQAPANPSPAPVDNTFVTDIEDAG